MAVIIRGVAVADLSAGGGTDAGEAMDILIIGETISRMLPSEPGLDPTLATSEARASGEVLETIDGRGMVALPSLVNGHAHSPMTLLRGLAEDMELMPWLSQAILPLEARMDEEAAYWGLRLAALEMIESGTTLCNDMYFFPEALGRAARDSGMRFELAWTLVDGLDEDKASRQRMDCAAFFDNLPDMGRRVGYSLGCHSVYATSASSIAWAAGLAADRRIPLHLHLAETQEEDRECRKAYGLSPAARLDSLGALGTRTLAAHCLWLDESDFDLLAKRGVAIVHNPASNMKLASGPAFDYEAAASRGITVLLGTDGAASNNSLDLFSDMKLAGLLQKQHFRDPKRFPVRSILSSATVAGHGFFKTGGGRIREGATADLILVDLGGPAMTPNHDLAANLVYAGSGRAVDTTICGGRVLMRAGRLVGEGEVIARAASAAEKMRRA